MEQRPALLMCPADFFSVRYVINPWMEGNVSRVSQTDALRQWRDLRDILEGLAEVRLIEPDPNLPDMVFTANAGVVLNGRVLPSRFAHGERRPEEPLFRDWFERHHFEVSMLPEDQQFEGAGDVLLDCGRARLWAGYGFRTSLEAHRTLADLLGVEAISLRLIDPRFYHLDTCLCPLEDGFLIHYSAAFDFPSQQRIRDLVPPDRLISIGESDAVEFACNAVNIGRKIVLHSASDGLKQRLADAGFEVITTPLNEFLKAGGAAKCLTLRLDESVDLAAAGFDPEGGVRQETVELEGHLLDGGILDRALDMTADCGGSFKVLDFELGRDHASRSRATIQVAAPAAEVMRELRGLLLSLGARFVDSADEDARLGRVETDGVAPEDFYGTTIYPTDVRVDGHWIRASHQRMDAVIVVDTDAKLPTAECHLLRDLKKGDCVVTGMAGIRTAVPEPESNRAKSGADAFAFMSAGVSSERRVEGAVEKIAWDMRRIHERSGRIVVVAGPVVVHTGGATHLARLVRAGYVQALLGGNAIAVHDIEQAIMGTSLGVDCLRGLPVRGGHRHHLRVINLIRCHGGIAAAVQAGAINSGILYECVRAGVPYSLAGSIRDDGPLPDTETDMNRAQNEYARLIEGADMILMLSSMLHSIGTGNMTPAGVKLVCVDINPAVVTKLADRGSLESTGIVTDVGLFLDRLSRQLVSDGIESRRAGGKNADSFL